MLRPEQILNVKFTPVSKGTYNAEEVDAFLRSVAESYEESLANNQELIKKISILADKIESYRNDEEAIKLALLDAHKMAESVNKSANEKADAIVSDAENKSKIILDGANRQADQTISEAKEKAKEIVDNAKTAVTSLQQKAQTEAETAVAEANRKAAEIVANAEEKGREIIGTSKQSYEFYSAELEKIQAETTKFKAAMENICKGQLNLLGDIPETFAAVVSAASTMPVVAPAEETFEETVEEIPAEEPVEEFVAQEEVAEVAEEIETVVDEIDAVEPENVIEEEHDESAVALMAEIDGLADDVFIGADNAVAEDVAEEYEADEEYSAIGGYETAEEFEVAEEIAVSADDDDLFSMIEDVEFDDVSDPDSFPASLDDFVPMMPAAQEEEEISLDIDEIVEEESDDEFDGFRIDLDSVADDSNEEDEDITSLFDSLFDD